MDTRLLPLQVGGSSGGARHAVPLQADLFPPGLGAPSDPFSFQPPTPLSPSSGEQSEETKLKEAARSFEGYFVYMLFKEMQKTTPKGSLFGSGPGGNLYEHLFQQAMADKIASGPNGFGLTSFLMRSLQKRTKSADLETSRPEGEEGLPLRREKGLIFKTEGAGLRPPRLNLSV